MGVGAVAVVLVSRSETSECSESSESSESSSAKLDVSTKFVKNAMMAVKVIHTSLSSTE